MKFQHTFIALLSLLAYANAYDFFTTTLANQSPVCSPVDVTQNVCTEVCGRFVRYVPDAATTNQFTFTEYTTNQCTVQVTPAVTNTFTCADQTSAHALGSNWSGICKITTTPPVTSTATPTVTPTITPTPTPSQTSTTTGSASTVVASFSISITHSGVGSIASILKSAIPSIILPLYFDQPCWSKYINSIGAGIGLNGLKLKQNQLLDSILKIKSNYQQFKNRCIEISSNLSNDSLEKAIQIIENN
ncbi:hypothetical protein ACTFIY_010948 [Dictyostelium cf. discoideum]